MNHALKQLPLLLLGIACVANGATPAANAIVPDLQKVSQGIGATITARAKAKWDGNVKGKAALFTTGIIWLDEVNFSEGTLECDILGKAAPRGSNFPGLVFHGVNDTTYDSVYFRPFNFRAENPENAAHAVQYVAPPDWTWQKLRSEKTGEFEKPITPKPDGDAWFRAKVVVEGRKVSVFVNDAAKPSLVVEKQNNRMHGKVGISGGDAGDGGYFANLRITPKKP